MNITYDTIINFLSDNDKSNCNFPTKKNILKYAKEFNIFSDILPNKYFRYGVQQYDNDKNNISFYSSILHLLNKKFVLKDQYDQITYVNTIKNDINQFLKKNYKKFHLKNKFDKEYSRNLILSNKSNPLIIELISFSLSLNIIIFDFEKEKIFVNYDNNFLNPWKPTILLSKFKNIWEPIYSDNKKIFSYNDNIIKSIYDNDILYYESEYLSKEFVLLDNINELLQIEKEKDGYIEDDKSEENDYFISKKKFKNNFTENKLKKMRKDELIELINELNINIISTKKTKKNLIVEILSNI
jgi:hypothetical protein